eukprot:355965-Chlamydomonas_euryale.AAC.2
MAHSPAPSTPGRAPGQSPPQPARLLVPSASTRRLERTVVPRRLDAARPPRVSAPTKWRELHVGPCSTFGMLAYTACALHTAHAANAARAACRPTQPMRHVGPCSPIGMCSPCGPCSPFGMLARAAHAMRAARVAHATPCTPCCHACMHACMHAEKHTGARPNPQAATGKRPCPPGNQY